MKRRACGALAFGVFLFMLSGGLPGRGPGSRPPARSVRGVLRGWVSRVADGDTVTLQIEKGQIEKGAVRIRLLGIDAPELSMRFGRACRDRLARLVAGREVRVLTAGTDRYGRTIGQILMDGRDVNLTQIEMGCAWHYRQFSENQAPEDRNLYALKEIEARQAAIGLWRDAHPRAPWDYRRENIGRENVE